MAWLMILAIGRSMGALRVDFQAGALPPLTAARMPGRSGVSAAASRSRRQTPIGGGVPQVAARGPGAEQKTSGFDERDLRPCSCTAFWRCSSYLSFLALRLAASSGLSAVTSLPSVSQVQVPASPVDPARAALDLDQEEALGVNSEQVDLVDAAVVGDELEVGPGPVRLVVGKRLADEVEGVPLPRDSATP